MAARSPFAPRYCRLDTSVLSARRQTSRSSKDFRVESNAMKNNSIGVHNLVFVTDWSEASARQAIRTAAEIGFDHIEVVIFDPLTTATDLTVRLAKEAGIDVAAGMALNPAADLSTPMRRSRPRARSWWRIASSWRAISAHPRWAA